MKPLQIEGARALASAGAIKNVKLIASQDGLYVEINDAFTVANRVRQTRFFAKADTCFSWLREMGITHVDEVDLSHWGIEKKPTIPVLANVLAIWKFGVATAIGEEWVWRTQRVEALSQKGKHVEALKEAEKALQAAEESLKPDHPDIAELLNNLAIQHYALGQFKEAQALYQRALANAEKTLGKNDPLVGACLNNLAEVLEALGESESVESMYLRALAICEKHPDPNITDQSNAGTILTNLASLYLHQADYAKAEPLFTRALAIWKDFSGWLGTKHPNEERCLEGLAELYRKTNREKKAVPLEKRAATIKSRSGSANMRTESGR